MEAIIKAPEEELTDLERTELTKWRRGAGTELAAPLAQATALKMYQLYLLGHSCEEIVAANENRFPLGMVLDARVRFEWDRRRMAYLDKLYAEAGEIVKQRQIEGAFFLGDMLAAAHIQFGDKLKKFIQTRNPDDLPKEFKIDSITKYKMIVDALIKITGQDKKESPGAAVQVVGNNVVMSQSKPVTGEDAFDLIKSLQQLDDVDGRNK